MPHLMLMLLLMPTLMLMADPNTNGNDVTGSGRYRRTKPMVSGSSWPQPEPSRPAIYPPRYPGYLGF
ncbi:hypothetical protein SAMD00023353_0401470 [Rosellinia necatrix]|uniref:Uncharacterized protein n=1 Tax=Rosellinia necatrix TaxID=77044 RepID=A0A1S8A5L4_ROSNE|nr:hypothetical protein SAMD00023353_0401470 [Rosellinia necatrix]